MIAKPLDCQELPDRGYPVYSMERPKLLLGWQHSISITRGMSTLHLRQGDLSLAIKIQQRVRRLDRHVTDLMPRKALVERLYDLDIPSSSTCTYLHLNDSFEFEWNCLSVTLDQAEKLFDHDSFEPVEVNGPDPTAKEWPSQGYSAAPGGGAGGGVLSMANGGLGFKSQVAMGLSIFKPDVNRSGVNWNMT